jgi:polyhydroxybutyrate depolymerase
VAKRLQPAPWFACLLLLATCLVCAQAQAGNRRHSLKYQNLSRYYFVHIPPHKHTRYALVINLHGGGSHGRDQEQFSDMNKTADKYGFYVVYPNGIGKLQNRFLTWNAGDCCGYAHEHHSDDVGFLSRVLDAVIKQYPIDPRRVYVTGMSNGAKMAFYLAEKLPNRIAAIAPVSGGRIPDSSKALKPMPIMYFHSLDDPRALYHGGLGPAFPFTNQHVLHPDIDAVLAAWAKINGCSGARKQVDLRTYASEEKFHTAHKLVYQDCKRAPIILWQLEKSGHVWPGGRQDYLESVLGESTQVIDANEEMWQFFQQFRVNSH